MPKERWYVSFDEKEALWQDALGFHRVLHIGADPDGDFRFYLGSFEDPWYDFYCLLSFRDAE